MGTICCPLQINFAFTAILKCVLGIVCKNERIMMFNYAVIRFCCFKGVRAIHVRQSTASSVAHCQ